ncbi:uncharacterized protein LACBIDRAFT_304571 [Laccaria bicolor S238N-H82]|uniref:Predicted protein n=1 Tax=Laccaria bicolor (strain S238N-H82 / ATCC MYA-4686) TaxID=486041 RepID=B0DLX5_LACBS|nr:uncharacterized protein LACBIDRAFT_304571 [Laccaria bicolor S238N-H82]EDR04368.1 predicted protein [Laccaria bicolor S238N-H82]|eukprot:XP_001884887.1 predicted protein [Laccaria bicolor S238N-H82]
MLASLAPAHFLKRLFVQSEAESGKFGEVSTFLHLAVIIQPITMYDHHLCLHGTPQLVPPEDRVHRKFPCRSIPCIRTAGETLQCW